MKFYTQKRDGYTLKMSRSLPYRGYGQVWRAAVKKAPPPPPPPKEPTYHLPPGVGARPTELEYAGLLPNSNLTAVDERGKATAEIAGGVALTGGGVAGGVGLAVAGGPLSTGLKVLAGLASVASAIGGGALTIKGRKDYIKAAGIMDSKRRLEEILASRTAPANLTPEDGNLVVQYDDPLAFLNILPRTDPAIPTEIKFHSKSGKPHLPDVVRNRVDMGDGLGTVAVQGLNIGLPPGRWAKVAYMLSVTKKFDIRRAWGSAEGWQTGSHNKTTFKDMYDRDVCTAHCWHYGQPRTKDWTWLAGGPPQSLIKDYRGDQPPVEWHVANVPEGLYFDASDNYWLTTAAHAWSMAVTGRDYPAEGTAERFPNPDEVKGPMAALMEIYKAFRGLSAEPVTIYGSPQGFQQAVVHAAKVIDVRNWWHDIESFFGTIFGIAACVTQAAMPIITAVNPALGAAISAAASSIYAAAGNLWEAYTGTARDLRDSLREGWSAVTNFYDNCEQVAWGYWDGVGLEMPSDVQSLYPADQVMDMTWRTYSAGSGSILATINVNEESPIYIKKLVGYVNPRN